MGTNYYAQYPLSPACPTCNHRDVPERLHIGKSSGGWCFSLHVIPERGLNDWPEWRDFLSREPVTIEDEYGDVVSLDQLAETVTNRRWLRGNRDALWFTVNSAEPGPHGLARHRIGRGCFKHGAGTWDCVAGEFS